MLDTSPKARKTKAKMSYCDFIKMKIFFMAKEMVNNNKKGNLQNRRRYLQMIDKRLVYKIYKELLKLNPQKTNNPVKK